VGDKGRFEIIEGITSADIALRLSGPDIESIFHGAAKAFLSVMLEDSTSALPHDTRTISLVRENEELLLFAFLDELVFLKDAENLLVVPRAVAIQAGGGGLTLRCDADVDFIDRERHRFIVDEIGRASCRERV